MTKVLFVNLDGERGSSMSINHKEHEDIVYLQFTDGRIYNFPNDLIDRVNSIQKRGRLYRIEEPSISPLDEAQAILDDPAGVTYGLRACRAIENIIEYLKAKDKEWTM